MDATFITQQPKGMTNKKLPIVLTDISAILGLLMLIMSFAYLFIAVSVTKEKTKLDKKCACAPNQTPTQVLICRSKGAPIANSSADQNANATKKDDSKAQNRFCRNLLQEYAAGGLGIFFGLFQTVVACVFLLAGVPEALRLIWIIVHAVIAFVCAFIVLLVFDVMLYKFLNRSQVGTATSIYFPDEFLHDGSPTSVKRANTVVFVYFAFVFLDAIATIMGIVLMVVTKQGGRVASTNKVKSVPTEGPLKEPGPAIEALG